MSEIFRRIKTVKNVTKKYHYRYFENERWYSKESENTYIKLLKAKTLKECDKIIGYSSWTHFDCNDCGKSFSEVNVLNFKDLSREYMLISVKLCDDCFAKFSKNINLINKYNNVEVKE